MREDFDPANGGSELREACGAVPEKKARKSAKFWVYLACGRVSEASTCRRRPGCESRVVSVSVHWNFQMEKKQGRKGISAFQGSTLREESTGVNHASTSYILKIKHLQRLATWAGAEVGIPPLGALFGNRLAANAEAAGIPLDPSISLCQRCESVLNPGLNCTVRIEKVKNKARRGKKPQVPSQNNVVYTCHFCSHRNLKGGTPKGHVKSLVPAKQPLQSDLRPSKKVTGNSQTGSAAKCELELKRCNPGSDTAPMKSPVTPLLVPESSSKKKRKASVAVPSDIRLSKTGSGTTESGEGKCGSSKRRRKGWTGLKEIAERNETENIRRIGNFAIPFLLQCESKDDKIE